jgi:vancomycin resistance protein YoaR
MGNITAKPSTLPRPINLIPQILTAIAGGLLVFALLLFGFWVGYNVYYSGKVYPGVTVAGIDLSGMEPTEAVSHLETSLGFPSQGKILLRDGDKIWLASPSEVGFYLNPQTSVSEAYYYGRSGGPTTRLVNQFEAWYLGISLAPQYIFDEKAALEYLEGVAAQTDIQKVEASLTVEGSDVVVREGRIGRHLDLPATLEDVRAQLQTMRDGEIELAILDDAPVILNVEEQAQLARQILSEPLTLKVPKKEKNDPGPWTYEPDALAQMITIERVTDPEGDYYQVGLQAESLRSFLDGIAPQLYRQRENGGFIFNDDTRQLENIQPAVIGRSLNVDGTIEKINQKLLAGSHKVTLDVESIQPEVGDDATAEQLGITELVSSHTSYFYGSSSERIQNITISAEQFHGILVPPGGTFSMGDALGDVTLDNGYAEALIIFGNRTIQGVGGGVCQVSTTLFRTVFFGGFPVEERYPHAYRVGYYELKADGGYNTSMAGLDATVYTPLVDFKFTNDTSNWLLMETYVNQGARTLTWKFYSTSDGRSVEWNTSGLKNVVEPPDPVYEENAELAKGTVKQVDWAVKGADVTVTRSVSRDGKTIIEDTFSTHYMPWKAVYQYGPGTKNMPPDEDKEKKDNNG